MNKRIKSLVLVAILIANKMVVQVSAVDNIELEKVIAEDIETEIVISNEVNEDNKISDISNKATVPVITVEGCNSANSIVYIPQNIGQYDILPLISATDAEDGEISLVYGSNIFIRHKTAGDVGHFFDTNITAGVKYTVTIEVRDSDGRSSFKEIVITINGKAVISGLDPITIFEDSVFDPINGVTITDKEYGTIPNTNLDVIGTVDTTVPGEYTLTYEIKDSFGQTTSETRVITVDGKPVITGEDITLIQGSTYDQLSGITVSDEDPTVTIETITIGGDIVVSGTIS